MGARGHLLLVALCLLGAGAAPPAQQPPPPPPPRPTPFGRTMSTVITVAISVFFFLLFFCAYINQCRLAGEGGAMLGHNVPVGGGPSRRGKRGLDPAVVATFPIVPYREVREHKIGRGELECAVCLTAFEEADDLRLLPHCSHVFHPECIDPWLETRVTCPLCRANLEKPPPPPLPAAIAPPSPEPTTPRTPIRSPPHAVAIAVPPAQQEEGEESDEDDRKEESDEDDRKEEAMELETLRSERRAARLPRSNSTGHSRFAASAEAAARSDHERFTLRLPHHVREQVLTARRLRHATSLIDISGMSPDGSSRGGRRAGPGGSSFGNPGTGTGGGGGSSHGGRRWQGFLARTMSWARGGGDGSVRKGWDGSTRRGRDDAESSRKGAASPSPAAARP
ncbi:E3 ubiquitin-protein ligase ATL6-like [Lolium rigidum]|uniref:E3 ubiquitin-protein ligase ATL6-like n=1 Tax=Lolium rigidum TaxID=89674 RepID=UPI001F5D3BA1|nr:E3 ubiquitin-protein ligase ATL6-like [Lolium rigidum]